MIKPFIYFTAKLLAIFSSLTMLFTAGTDIRPLIISALAFSCLLLAELLVLIKLPLFKLKWIIISVVAFICFFVSAKNYFPMFAITIVQISCEYSDKKLRYEIIFVSVVLLFLLFPTNTVLGLITIILVITTLTSIYLCERIECLVKASFEKSKVISELNFKNSQMQQYIKTVRSAAIVEERNRFSSRIHDKLGHGVSGSIIMLEAAMLILKNEPDKAEKTIRKATENLRDSVNNIRIALYDERPAKMQIGMTHINQILEEFKISYNTQASAETKGDLSKIPHEIWQCIIENLKEALTNFLKHSNGTKFVLKIEVMNKILKVQYEDDGKSYGKIKYGIGLEAINERIAVSCGRMLIQNDTNGFRIINIFKL